MEDRSSVWGLVKLRNLWSDSLYRNSFWLMAGSFSMAAVGFIYWLIAARLYTPTEIGLATTFLSAVALVNGFSTLGFGMTLIRYLPTSDVKEKKINTTFTVVSLAALIIGIIYLLGLPIWTPKLLFLRESIPILIIAILYFPINTINAITDSVFTALKETYWVFVSNVTQSITKLLLLFFLTTLGVWGVIGSNMVASVVAVIVCLLLIIFRYKINIHLTLDKAILHKVKKFALGNYISGLIGGLPTMLLPIIITNRISPEQTAYFYMPNMIGSLLMIVPYAMARSYFAESSGSTELVSMRKPMLISYIIILPIVTLLAVFGKYILAIYGQNYAVFGYSYLLLISVSTVLYVAITFLSYRQLILDKLVFITTVQSISAVEFLLLAYIFTFMGIAGVGVASVITSFTVLLIYLINYTASHFSNITS